MADTPQRGLLADITDYLNRVIRGEVAMQGLNELDVLLQRSMMGDTQALGDLAGMFAGGGVIKEMRAPAWNKAIRSFPLAEKATRRDLKGLLMESDTLRALDTPSGLYAWPANAALHEDVARMLGLPLDAKQFGLLTRESLR